MMKHLLRLNNFLYNFWFHVPFFIFWVFIVISNNPEFLADWFRVGLIFYILLMIITLFIKKAYPPKIKTFSDTLGYLVGLNICVLFSFFSIILMMVLNYKKK